ncbi:hypothetical protein SAMN02745824_1292 [Parasphingorhabdus marina DSM 22363]|uniref:Uncharacterized protein n=1 Tax=Parasphingorhabdus marina DSM 22363 TaxID=1123272 RepID=A0A1N6CZA6_9SPHN|nr:hypothetical protein [Parasphingorhabdus marina]SIN63784.1 hypothetical protein SAMN02745824_1292 [Parasphingorhabdus marina DSM 22363]
MLTGKPDFLDRLAQFLVAAVGIFALLFGAFMIISPLDWYTAIPTVITTGPPNKHFIRDIGIAYSTSGIILLYASVNIHMRWLVAFAGSLWLALHGILHIYEVSVGICSPDIFWADAPGVLGPPLLVHVALTILFLRQRVAPAGIPDLVFLGVVDRMTPGESAYVHEIAGAPGHALEKFKHFMPASNHRTEASADLLAATRIGAVLAEDCGPCAITAAEGALADNVDRDTVNRMLRGDLSGDQQTAFAFGQAMACQSEEAFSLGDRLEQDHGRTVRLELAMAAATVRVYPAMKRGLGLSRACSLTPLQV